MVAPGHEHVARNRSQDYVNSFCRWAQMENGIPLRDAGVLVQRYITKFDFVRPVLELGRDELTDVGEAHPVFPARPLADQVWPMIQGCHPGTRERVSLATDFWFKGFWRDHHSRTSICR